LNLLGKSFDTKRFGKCSVVGYDSEESVIVMFHRPLGLVKTPVNKLKTGNIFNPYAPSVAGVGYLGVGAYSCTKNIHAYNLWNSLLKRVYDGKRESYSNVRVCKSWHNFQNFASWCESQPFFNTKDDNGKNYHLDKDILSPKDSKVYSPETCCFVPQEINKLVMQRDKSRGKYPVGVYYSKKDNRYTAQYSVGKSTARFIGNFMTPEEAFQAYKEAKELFIIEKAEDWRGRIEDRVYLALLDYNITVND
jgi:hypothetical protein